MQTSIPYIYGQIEYLEKSLSLLKKTVVAISKKHINSRKLYGSLPKTNISFFDFKNLRKKLSSSWEKEWI